MNAKAFEEKLMDANKKNIKAIDLQFIDIFGNIKFKTVSFPEFTEGKVYLEGYGIDGSSIHGYGVPIEESDLVIIPDPQTFHILPWARDISRVICDVYSPAVTKDAMQPFVGDTRQLLKTNIKSIPDSLSALMDIKDQQFQYHVAPSQYEFDFRYGEALDIADSTVTLKDIIKNYAEKYELKVTFMPKPFFGMNGSGMHCHINLSMITSQGEKVNLFYDQDKQELSDIAKYFVAGLLKHAPALTAITNTICNSYKRLVPGWEAPTKIAWGRKNRSALIRLPHGNPKATRCEYRSPDPVEEAVNYYVQPSNIDHQMYLNV